MNEFIKNYYDLDVLGISKITSRVFKIKTKGNNYYALKFIKSKNENIYSHLSLLNLDSFVLPIKNNLGYYVSELEGKYIILTIWYDDEPYLASELKMKFFIQELTKLHLGSFYEIKVNKGYYEDLYEKVERLIYEGENNFNNYLTYIERLEYKSPVMWLYLLNNQKIFMAYNKSKELLEKFKNEFQNLDYVRVTLSYQNFNLDNIILKSKKIIGEEKMNIAPLIFDIKDIFEKSYDLLIDILHFMKEYFEKLVLTKSEYYLLFAFIYLPRFSNEGNDEVLNIVEFTKGMYHLRRVEEFDNLVRNLNKIAEEN